MCFWGYCINVIRQLSGFTIIIVVIVVVVVVGGGGGGDEIKSLYTIFFHSLYRFYFVVIVDVIDLIMLQGWE